MRTYKVNQRQIPDEISKEEHNTQRLACFIHCISFENKLGLLTHSVDQLIQIHQCTDGRDLERKSKERQAEQQRQTNKERKTGID